MQVIFLSDNFDIHKPTQEERKGLLASTAHDRGFDHRIILAKQMTAAIAANAIMTIMRESPTGTKMTEVDSERIFRLSVVLLCILCGLAWYQRTINMWALKNIGDTFLTKDIGTRQIVMGVFQRQKNEQNVNGKFAVIHFLGDGRMEHPLYCFSKQPDNRYLVSHATVQRIHRGKRASSDICSWAGHIAECELEVHTFKEFRIGTTPDVEDAMIVTLEQPLREPRHDLVVCMAPMYIYTDWETLLVGIETWLALGATKIIVPVQSASSSSYKILKEYEKRGLVIIRTWPKWPVLSDSNPNGLVLSRESHVNCLFFAKPWANMIVFSDIDDLLLPVDPMQIKAGINVEILKNLFAEHPQAGSLLFEHRDVQFQLPILQAHFYHLRHSHHSVSNPTPIDMSNLATALNRHVDCVAARAEYDFFRSGSGYFLQTTNVSITASDPNCEAPVPQIVAGNHYFAP
ncbi:hypothetical protein TELCIR_09551 [Teladorsagia circumcincta]|uniref:Glycosyltransferase family 92 protein n=1 Tax=Teladorsagia circumcincta TaxID=45464 RepID=A0A2G9UGM4_TELCI|nr:hypothetical protein TELCIR_09551 [Teladorsagia circumcincta]